MSSAIPPNKVYLSRRNLEVLLSKLDRVKAGEHSFCEIWKRDDEHPTMPSDHTRIIAVEDKDYYFDREPGAMLPIDVKSPS